MSGAIDGLLVIDKPAGMTSHDVVAALRRRLPRQTKVGHTGTLDPFATGVLPVVIGKATRLSQFLTSSRKHYLATVAFGRATDSGDSTGTVTEIASPDGLARLDVASLRAALESAVGTHAQVPPAHSAKKVEGERAYVLVRRGEAVDLPPVDVTAYAVALTAWNGDAHEAIVSLETSAGYYVRSFARDLGRLLGVPAHLTALRRTASGEFDLADAHPLETVLAGTRDLAGLVRPMSGLLGHLPAVHLGEAQVAAVRQGRQFTADAPDLAAGATTRVRLIADGDLVGLAHVVAGQAGLLHADVVLI